MDGRFSRALGRLHSMASVRLSDSTGSYSFGSTLVSDISLMVDRNLQREGPEGTFLTGAVGISWPASQLAGAERGAVFEVGGERFIIDDMIADDGYYLTAACMVQT